MSENDVLAEGTRVRGIDRGAYDGLVGTVMKGGTEGMTPAETLVMVQWDSLGTYKARPHPVLRPFIERLHAT
ncbi:MAG TPA: hypothetical protein VFH00_02645 [Candidatus Nitrosotalea sp.]|nr:hypothetical protein [Candidatus Nitrosotalea sp.]